MSRRPGARLLVRISFSRFWAPRFWTLCCVAIVGFAVQPVAAQYSVTILHPPGAAASSGEAISSTGQGGFVRPTSGDAIHAAIWSGTAGSVVDLHQASWTDGSIVTGVAGAASVGYSLSTTGNERALLWTGPSAASAVALHPASGYNSTFALGTSGNVQVGYGLESAIGYERALMWNGSAGSVVELHPQNVAGNSIAFGAFGNYQVGYLEDFSVPVVNGYEHASLWQGSAASRVDLHPTSNAYETSIAYAVDATSQGGWGQVTNTLDNHALLWHGSAASVVDLNPAGFLGSAVYGVGGSVQVGEGYVAPNGESHALLWTGSAASAVDLHSFLPSGFFQSQALGIDAATGVIVGVAFQTNTDVNGVAVIWTPVAVPEPAGWIAAILGAVGWQCRRWRLC